MYILCNNFMPKKSFQAYISFVLKIPNEKNNTCGVRV